MIFLYFPMNSYYLPFVLVHVTLRAQQLLEKPGDVGNGGELIVVLAGDDFLPEVREEGIDDFFAEYFVGLLEFSRVPYCEPNGVECPVFTPHFGEDVYEIGESHFPVISGGRIGSHAFREYFCDLAAVARAEGVDDGIAVREKLIDGANGDSCAFGDEVGLDVAVAFFAEDLCCGVENALYAFTAARLDG